MARIGIVGVGSIGSVLANGFHQLGHDIVINDTNPDATQELPYPSHPKRWLALNCDYVIFALPTPTHDYGGDASIIDHALDEFHDANATLILRSTMPPGTTKELATKHELPLVYSPEFLRDRSTVDDFFEPDRIVLAGPNPEREQARDLLDNPQINSGTIIETRDYITAELGKEAHNAFFATKVSFANQIRLLAERAGSDPSTVMEIVTADSRNTTSHLDPMLGPYGGKCLPKDTEALEAYGRNHQTPTELLEGVIQLNNIAREEYENVEIQGNYPNITIQSD